MEWNGMCICVWRFKCSRQTNVKCENNASTQRIFSCPSIFLELIPMIFWIIPAFFLVVVCNHSNRWHSVNYSELIVCLMRNLMISAMMKISNRNVSRVFVHSILHLLKKFSAKTDSNILNIQTIRCTYTKQTRKIISKRIHIEWPEMAMNSDDGS